MNWDKNIKNRLWRTLVIFLIIAVFLSAALFNAQILRGKEYKQLAKVQRTDRIRSLYLRGSIFDRDRNLLAESTNRPSLAAHPYRMRNPRLVGRVLSKALNLDEKKIIEILISPPEITEVKKNVDLKMQKRFALAKKRFPKALKGIFVTPVGDGTSLPSLVASPNIIRDRRLAAKLLAETMGFNEKETFESLRNINKFVYLAYKMSYDLENKFKIAKEKYRLQLKDVFAVEEESGKRIYPKRTLAGHILGFSGFDDKGMSGVELSFNPQLKGGASYALAEVDPLGRLLPGSKILRKSGATSLNLVLTIDEYIQYQAERELLDVVKNTGARGGCIIVMNVRTGEILAMTNYPLFNPEKSGKLKSLFPAMNRCIGEVYEPGSTLKVFTVAAGLDSGLVKQTDTFTAGGTITVDGWLIANANDGFGALAREIPRDILTYSYNVGAASIGLSMQSKKPGIVSAYLRRFGFGHTTGIDLPGEQSGIMSAENEIRPINVATMSFGQGISVTPLQLISGYQAIANDGVRMRPLIVRELIDKNGSVALTYHPEKIDEPITPETAGVVKSYLINVATEGTAKKAQIKGYIVGGKTGTAQIPLPTGGYDSGNYVASFVGFAPADDPKLVILVKVDAPKGCAYGGVVAAPIFSRLARTSLLHMNIPPDDSIINNKYGGAVNATE